MGLGLGGVLPRAVAHSEVGAVAVGRARAQHALELRTVVALRQVATHAVPVRAALDENVLARGVVHAVGGQLARGVGRADTVRGGRLGDALELSGGVTRRERVALAVVVRSGRDVDVEVVQIARRVVLAIAVGCGRIRLRLPLVGATALGRVRARGARSQIGPLLDAAYRAVDAGWRRLVPAGVARCAARGALGALVFAWVACVALERTVIFRVAARGAVAAEHCGVVGCVRAGVALLAAVLRGALLEVPTRALIARRLRLVGSIVPRGARVTRRQVRACAGLEPADGALGPV